MTTEQTVPAAAALLRDLVNSREPQTGEDELTSPDAVRAWFAARGLVDRADPLDAHDARAVVAVREGLREALLAHAGHPADPAVLAELDRRLGEVPVSLSIAGGSPRLVPRGPRAVDRALAAVVDAVREATVDGSWPRLKVCARDTCRWAFYDASRNQARRWCSMAGCGNYVKMRRVAEARRRGAPGQGGGVGGSR